jgi:hypothetical protein
MKRILAIGGLVAVAMMVGLSGCGKAALPTDKKAEGKAASQVQLTAAFEKIKGKWMRSDGGYSLEFKGLKPNNELEAAYFNPGPIHIGKAKISEERGFTNVFVELQDVNYPGSRYTLFLDAEKNRLVGSYFQATQQVTYEVSFDKM